MKRKEILGAPVTDLKSAVILGHVTEVALGLEELRVLGLYVRRTGAGRRIGFVPLEAVETLCPRVVLFSGAMARAKKPRRIEEACVLDLQGRFLGRAKDLDFDPACGQIRRFWMKRSLTDASVDILGESGIHRGADGNFVVTGSTQSE